MNKYLKTLTLIQLSVAVVSGQELREVQNNVYDPLGIPGGHVCLYPEENYGGTRVCYEQGTKANLPENLDQVRSVGMGRDTFRFLMYNQKDSKEYIGSIGSSQPKLDLKFQDFSSFYLVKPAFERKKTVLQRGRPRGHN